MSSNITIRQLNAEDLPLIARVHMDSFPDSALTRLGPAVVEQYYSWQLTGPHEKVRAAGAFVGGECAGFSFSGIFRGSASGFVRRYRSALTKAVLRHPRLLFSSQFRRRLREGIRLLRLFAREKPETIPAEPSAPPAYGILSIAVAPSFQKLGIGQILMLDAEEEALRYGCKEICLTVHPANKKAVQFYERQNWQRFSPSDLWKGAMIKTLR